LLSSIVETKEYGTLLTKTKLGIDKNTVDERLSFIEKTPNFDKTKYKTYGQLAIYHFGEFLLTGFLEEHSFL
jgi:hypothetical protein